MGRIGTWFGLATAVAAILVLVVFVVSRYSRRDAFFERNWEFLALTLGVLVLGVIITTAGVLLFYSVEYAFLSGSGLLSVLLTITGLVVVLLAGISLILVLSGNDLPFAG